MTIGRPQRDLLPLGVALLLVLVAQFEPSWTTQRAGTLAILLDVSESVPVAARQRTIERLAAVSRDLGGNGRTALLTFDETPEVHGLAPPSRVEAVYRSIEPESTATTMTDLGLALDQATRLVLASGGGSILVATDGRDPGERGFAAARAASAAGVSVHVLPLLDEEPAPAEVAIETLRVSSRTAAGEVYEAVALVRSSVDQRVEVTLEQEGVRLATRREFLTAGTLHGFRFLVKAPSASAVVVARVSPERDVDPGNNAARAHLNVSGTVRFAEIGYSESLGASADVWDHVPHDAILGRYDGILVRIDESFVPSDADQEALARHVVSGHGLVVTCADPGLAARLRGGPLDDVLPVRLEPPSRSGGDAAVVLLIDRSGSMESAEQAGSAFSTAARAAHSLVSLLEEGDRYGLIAFDVVPHVLRPLGPRDTFLHDSSGLPDLTARGGTDWAGALDLALEWLIDDEADLRHVVLIGDGRLGPGATGEPTRAWPDGMTLSTVSVGAEADRKLMKRLASRRGGRHDHVSRPQDLPAALRREGASLRLPPTRRGPVLARPEPVYVSLLSAVSVGQDGEVLVVSPRPGAEVALRTEADDPLLTFGRSGWGVSGFLAADPGSLQGLGAGPGNPVLVTALERVAGSRLEHGHSVDVSLSGTMALVEVLVGGDAAGLPQAMIRFPSGEASALILEWDAPDRAQGWFRPTESGEYVVDVDGARRRFLLDCPPERSRLHRDEAWAERLAAAGGGQVVPLDGDAAGSSPEIRPQVVTHAFGSALVALAAFVLFVDAVVRLHARKPSQADRDVMPCSRVFRWTSRGGTRHQESGDRSSLRA
jgi:hypothetical protein